MLRGEVEHSAATKALLLLALMLHCCCCCCWLSSTTPCGLIVGLAAAALCSLSSSD